ncbi:hypothetical protein Ancab_011487 [Ancistrocladus abbreviatus]
MGMVGPNKVAPEKGVSSLGPLNEKHLSGEPKVTEPIPTNGICVYSSTNGGLEQCQETLMYHRKPKKKSMEAIPNLSPKHGVASSKVLSLKANRMASKIDTNECSKHGVCSGESVHDSQFMNRNHILYDYGATGKCHDPSLSPKQIWDFLT